MEIRNNNGSKIESRVTPALAFSQDEFYFGKNNLKKFKTIHYWKVGYYCHYSVNIEVQHILFII